MTLQMLRELQGTFKALRQGAGDPGTPLSSFRVLQEGSRPSEGRVVSSKKQEPC